MAFLNNLRNVVRQTLSRQLNSEKAFAPSLYQSTRCMTVFPTRRIVIGGLSADLSFTDESSLRQEFAKYGEIVDASILRDEKTGTSRLGFVTFTNISEASSAIKALHETELHGGVVWLNYANVKPHSYRVRRRCQK